MQIRVLGCSGGIRQGAHTTAFLLDGDLLFDAGTGVGELELDEMAAIRHIVLSHSHLDHVAFLPFLLDTVFDRIDEPVVVHAQAETLEALRRHLFNDVLWPDFTRLPSPERPVVRLEPLEPGTPLTLGDRCLEMIPGHHVVPAVGLLVTTSRGTLGFSGDCTTNTTLWQGLNARERLDHLVVEAAFPDEQAEVARAAKHYTPRTLAADLEKLDHDPVIWITHCMPGKETVILDQCRRALPNRTVHPLEEGTVLEVS